MGSIIKKPEKDKGKQVVKGEIKGKNAKKLDKEIREERKKEIKEYKKKTKEEAKREEEIEFDKAAQMLANEFTYQQILDAVDGSAIEVYGFLEINFPTKWEDFLKYAILDRAAYFSKKKYVPEITNYMPPYDLEKCFKNYVSFVREYTFNSYPNRPFKHALIYSPKPLKELIKWIRKYEIIIDGYDARVTLGKVNFLRLGWAKPDFPQLLLTYTPGQNQALFDAIINAEKLKRDQEDLYCKLIDYLRPAEEIAQKQIEGERIRAERFKRDFSNFFDKIETEYQDDWVIGVEEARNKEKSELYIDKRILYILFILIVVFILISVFGVIL